MTTTIPAKPDRIEPVREEEYVVPLTGQRRARHLHRLLEMRDAFAKLSTERYCHSLPDAGGVFTMMAACEEEIAVLYPDIHAHLFPEWMSNIASCGHEPGQYNGRCGICLAHRPRDRRASTGRRLALRALAGQCHAVLAAHVGGEHLLRAACLCDVPPHLTEGPMTDRHTVQRLDLATATGLWRIEGASGTIYTIDVDERLAIRQPAPGAPTGPYDGCWMHLISVVNVEGADVVRHGLRHRWDLDPAPGRPGITIWWIQTVATAIVAVQSAKRPHGRTPSGNEDTRAFVPGE